MFKGQRKASETEPEKACEFMLELEKIFASK